MRRSFFNRHGHHGGMRSPLAIASRYLAQARSFSRHNPVAINYAIDGLLVLGATSFAANTNNLFALRLGAGEIHLAMLQFLPQVLNLFLLIPAGLFADSLRNKRRMLTGSLTMAAILFLAVGAVGFSSVQPLLLFLAFLAMANGAIMLYSTAWQGYFPEVVEPEKRNDVLTLRTRMSMLVSFFIPLLTGSVLSAIPSDRGKIIAHQIFYGMVAILLLCNVVHLRKITAIDPVPPKKFKFEEIKKAGARLVKNRPFIMFAGVALLFHMTWHFDWTLYFIGQVNYLHMNELQLSLAVVGATAVQFTTLRFWSKRNLKHGVEKPVVFGIIGLAFHGLVMVIATALPLSIGPIVFIILHSLATWTLSTISLNFFQCLLPVLDKEYRSFSASVYTMLIALSNALMPLAGVAIYRGLGGGIDVIRTIYAFVFVLRIVAGGLWWLRVKVYLRQKREE